MSVEQVFRKIQRALETAGVPYMRGKLARSKWRTGNPAAREIRDERESRLASPPATPFASSEGGSGRFHSCFSGLV
jgi:hypothetical protein